MISHSVADTNKLASRLVKGLHGGDVVGLVGPLGAGKTTFVQGLARALGIKRPITSPTFILLQSYPVRLGSPPKKGSVCRRASSGRPGETERGCRITTLTHIDCYRLRDPQQLLDIGIREYLDDPHTLTVIEWADKVRALLPVRTLWIYFSHMPKDGERRLDIKPRSR